MLTAAQKRAQDQQDVGLAITSFSAEQLENLGLTSTLEIAAQVPGMQVQSFSPSFTIFNIRGVSQNSFADNLEAPVATYIDGAYVASINAIGGLLHFISRAPMRTPEGYLEGSVSARWEKSDTRRISQRCSKRSIPTTTMFPMAATCPPLPRRIRRPDWV